MIEGLPFLEGTDAIHIILGLYHSKTKISQSDLGKLTGSNATTIAKRIDELRDAGIIDFEIKPTVKNDVVIGGSKTKWVWLTPKGKKVAKKLLEIKEIMEEDV